MFIDPGLLIINQYGKPYRRQLDPDSPTTHEQTDLTLGFVIVEAILTGDGTTKIEGSKQVDRYLLAQRFISPESPVPAVELSHEQADTIKDMIAKRWTQTQIAGQAILMIDKARSESVVTPIDKNRSGSKRT